MQTKKLHLTLRLCLVPTVLGLLSACASHAPIGLEPAATPPRIITDPSNSSQRIWDKPYAFGPVPQNLAAKGQAVCSSLNTKDTQYKAMGYHPKGENHDGKSHADGSYYCVPK